LNDYSSLDVFSWNAVSFFAHRLSWHEIILLTTQFRLFNLAVTSSIHLLYPSIYTENIMPTIQWRPEVNALTAPQSYKMRFVPRNVIGTNELAAEIAAENPVYNQGLVKAMISAIMSKIQQNLIDGNQIILDEALSFSIGFTARLAAPDSPLPAMEEMLHVQIRALASFVKEIQNQAQLERLPMIEKVPIINTAEDTLLKLNDVLHSEGVVKLSGTNLFFKDATRDWECVVEGTRSGRTVQTRLGPVSATSLVFVPDIPEQDAPWNNEYTVSVTTRCTENGTLRTGTYRRRLRTLIAWDGMPPEGGVGILTGSAEMPYVTIESSTVTADEMLRIQAIFEPRDGNLRVNLLDMQEGGKAGVVVLVTGNGNYTLSGFAGSSVSTMMLTVHSYTALIELVRNGYSGRLVDVFDIRLT
jgi:hypothetical protein